MNRALVATLVALAALAALVFGGAPAGVVLAALALAHVPYALLLDSPCRRRHALRAAAVVLAVFVLAPPVFSTDVYRYAWDGWVLAHGHSPYALPPDDPSLAHLRRAGHDAINHAHLTTLYPPLAVASFAVVSPFGVLGPKLLAALAHLAASWLVLRAERRRVVPGGAATALALNPLVLFELGVEGHLEGLAVLPLVAGGLALSAGRTRAAFSFAALSSLVKLTGPVLLPALARRSLVAAAGVALTTVALAVGLASASRDDARSGLANYAVRWTGGAPAYDALAVVTEVGLAVCCTTADARVLLPLPDAARAWLARHDFGDAGALEETAGRVGVHRSVATPLVTRALAVLALLLAYVWIAARVADPLLATRFAVLALLCFVPRLLPWYAALLVPWEAMTGRRAGLLFALVALVGHAGDEAYARERASFDASGFTFAAGVLFAVAFVFEERALQPPRMSRASGLMR